MILGLRLLLLMGPGVPLPAPPTIGEALRSVEIREREEGRSGFELVFETGRSGPWDLLDLPLLAMPQLRPFSRVCIVGQFNASTEVLLDGIITARSLTPGTSPGGTRLTLTGEDPGVLLDMEEKRREFPGRDITMIVNEVLLPYVAQRILPEVLPPLIPDPALPIERVTTQQGTDLQYLRGLAEACGHVLTFAPGPAPGFSTARWGPPTRIGLPQPALSVDLGPATNVLSIRFEANALAPIMISDRVVDNRTGETLPVIAPAPLRTPLAALPAWVANQPNVRRRLLPAGQGAGLAGAMGRAQAMVDSASEAAVTAQGELDVARYGGVLRARALVGVRGAGFTHDGLWRVTSVGHTISRGQYRQNFSLAREGDGSLTPVVRP